MVRKPPREAEQGQPRMGGRFGEPGCGRRAAFQELAQIPAEAATLLRCPNHTSSFFLAAPPGAWQAPGFQEWNLDWGWGGQAGPEVDDEGSSRVGGLRVLGAQAGVALILYGGFEPR